MLPGGSGKPPSILAHLGWPGTLPFSPASRVSISELLGGGECHPSLLACVFGNP